MLAKTTKLPVGTFATFLVTAGVRADALRAARKEARACGYKVLDVTRVDWQGGDEWHAELRVAKPVDKQEPQA